MEAWMTWGFQLVITGMIGVITYQWKKQSERIDAALKESSARVEQVDAKHTSETAALRKDMEEKAAALRKETEEKAAAHQKELATLKADLPLVYVLREDFLRVMNSVEGKLDKLLYQKGNGG